MLHGYTTPPRADQADTQHCAVCPGKPTGHGTGYGAMTWRASEAGPPDPWSWLTPADGHTVRTAVARREHNRARNRADFALLGVSIPVPT